MGLYSQAAILIKGKHQMVRDEANIDSLCFGVTLRTFPRVSLPKITPSTILLNLEPSLRENGAKDANLVVIAPCILNKLVRINHPFTSKTKVILVPRNGNDDLSARSSSCDCDQRSVTINRVHMVASDLAVVIRDNCKFVHDDFLKILRRHPPSGNSAPVGYGKAATQWVAALCSIKPRKRSETAQAT
ncbi:hypothetical protein DEU50_13513 [Aeromonas salmonicida]|uniref:Uncharacterized protein n=1 Tax=Aeromonas salmonicida TaxID=645 RepID=A0AAX1PC35_AERSA|nr:hypothetical protein DEU50_13513 [Aeromonas salmonicida]